jgi:hypothetical protein
MITIPLVCQDQECGRLDATLRFTEFTSVASFIWVGSKKTVTGIWCEKCRKKPDANTPSSLRRSAPGVWAWPGP